MQPKDTVVDLQNQILFFFFRAVEQDGIGAVGRTEIEQRCTEEILQRRLYDLFQLIHGFNAAGEGSGVRSISEIIVIDNIKYIIIRRIIDSQVLTYIVNLILGSCSTGQKMSYIRGTDDGTLTVYDFLKVLLYFHSGL